MDAGPGCHFERFSTTSASGLTLESLSSLVLITAQRPLISVGSHTRSTNRLLAACPVPMRLPQNRSWHTRSTGEPLTRGQGFPLRLVVPGWYGVCNVKWLTHIRAQVRAIPRQVAGSVVPDAVGRRDRWRRHLARDRDQPAAREIDHRPCHAIRRSPHGSRIRAARWHAPSVSRDPCGRRCVAGSHPRPGDFPTVFLETVSV